MTHDHKLDDRIVWTTREKLEEMRAMLKMDKASFAAALGVTYACLSYWLSGARRPDRHIDRLLKALYHALAQKNDFFVKILLDLE